MAAHRFYSDWANASDHIILDPGTGNALPVSKCGVIGLVIGAGAETNTLAVPIRDGLRVVIAVRTGGGGTRTITFASAFNASGSTTMAFTSAAEWAIIESVASGTAFVWRSDGIHNSTTDGNLTDLAANLLATAAEINRSSDVSTRVVAIAPGGANTLAITELAHDGKTIYLTKTDGWNATLPAPVAGMKFRIVIGATITVASTIKSLAGTHIMIGHATMGNDTNNTTVDFQAPAASTYDTIDLLGTGNSTGGMEGQRITIEAMSSTRWFVEIQGDAAGTEATPFADTVT